MEHIQKYFGKATDLTITYAPRVLLALVTLWLGLKIIKWLVRLAQKSMEKANVETTLERFFSNLIGWGLKVLLFISVASMIGVETTSFVAVLGAAGLAVGLSLQGSLANLAGGVLIILFKPYKVGDLIEAQGQMGGVKEIQIFTTILVNSQNETIIIPNGAISNSSIKNYSASGQVRVDLSMGISYEANIQKAREILTDVMKKHPLVLDEPAPSLIVAELGDSSVNLSVRPWCKPEDYWTVMGDIMEQSKITLDENGITIPFPQMDVHLDKLKDMI